ncbi:hypothetical protein [Devosia sp. CAU 1758]
MHRLALLLILILGSALPGLAQDAQSQAAIDKMKSGKLMAISEVAVLMMGSERWCYREQEGNCAWSDIYLSVNANGATYEISNPWSEETDISFVDEAVFKEDRYICEMGIDWVPTVRAFERESGSAIEGRALAALKAEIYSMVTTDDDDGCFDYLYQHQDKSAETVTLLQRHYIDGVTDPGNDALVTLHFNKDSAEALGWYW